MCLKSEKQTSPVRSSDIMEQHTNKFIGGLNTLVERKTMNKNNLCVFDEIVINEPVRRIKRVERVEILVVKVLVPMLHKGTD